MEFAIHLHRPEAVRVEQQIAEVLADACRHAAGGLDHEAEIPEEEELPEAPPLAREHGVVPAQPEQHGDHAHDEPPVDEHPHPGPSGRRPPGRGVAEQRGGEQPDDDRARHVPGDEHDAQRRERPRARPRRQPGEHGARQDREDQMIPAHHERHHLGARIPHETQAQAVDDPHQRGERRLDDPPPRTVRRRSGEGTAHRRHGRRHERDQHDELEHHDRRRASSEDHVRHSEGRQVPDAALCEFGSDPEENVGRLHRSGTHCR